eukprot:gene27696-biopygen17727
MLQPQGIRGHDCDRRSMIPLSRQDVDDDIGGMDALTQRLGAGALDRGKTVAQHGSEDVDHLPIAIIGFSQFAANPLDTCRQDPAC